MIFVEIQRESGEVIKRVLVHPRFINQITEHLDEIKIEEIQVKKQKTKVTEGSS